MGMDSGEYSFCIAITVSNLPRHFKTGTSSIFTHVSVSVPGGGTGRSLETLDSVLEKAFVYSGSGGEPDLEIGIYPRVFPWRKVKTALV
jgi:hypothetical protein